MALQILIKPASGMCNMECSYCFYKDEIKHRSQNISEIMKLSTLEAIIKKAVESSNGEICFAFQGGEPTLAGISFFEKAITFAERYNAKDNTISWSIQTNGYMLNEAWIRFFAENKFLVGISVDGPKELHNYFRQSSNGKNTFTSVLNTITLFNKYKVDYNIVTVISSGNVRKPQTLYNFFEKNGFYNVQLIPCLNRLDGVPDIYSIKGRDYGEFLKMMFDLWYADWQKGSYISISVFDNFIRMLMNSPAIICGMNGKCSCQYVIEANGGVYPCDFYVLDDYCLGNINDNTFPELFETYKLLEFFSEPQYANVCVKCKWKGLCNNGCKRYRSQENLNVLCEAYAAFFEHCFERMCCVANFLMEIKSF